MLFDQFFNHLFAELRGFQGRSMGAQFPPGPGPVKSMDFKKFSGPNGC